MPLLNIVRNSKILRRPFLAITRCLFSLMRTGPELLRRGAYDSMSVPYLVTGWPEHFVVATADKVIGRNLFLHGEFDFDKLQVALAILAREGERAPCHLVDVGANIGTIVIPALKRGLIQTATAIEPHPSNLRLLRANLALNDLLTQVDVFGVAVGDASGRMLLLEESASNSGNHSIGERGIPVPSLRLDDIEVPLDNALLWMDIEGYEGHALKGAPKLLSAGMPVVCEYNPSYLSRSGGMQLFKEALSGRRIFDLSPHGKGEITWEELVTSYPDGPNFTDILAIAVDKERPQ